MIIVEVLYVTDAIYDFCNSLDDDTQVRVERLVGMLRTYGHQLRLPHSRALGSGLFELRLNGKHAVRLLYCYVGNRAYIVHAVMKKQGTILRSDIVYAQQIQQLMIAEI